MKILRSGIVLAIVGGMTAAYACGGSGTGGTTRTTGGSICGLQCSGTAVCDTPIGLQSGPVSIAGNACFFRGQDGTATLNCDGTGSATGADGTVTGTWTGSGTTVTGNFEGAWSCTITPATSSGVDAGTPDSSTEYDGGSVPDSGGGETLCTDTCEFNGDGDCDDGGPNSDFSLCTYGTDCTDCGPR